MDYLVSEKVTGTVERIAGLDAVKIAFDYILQDDERSVAETVELARRAARPGDVVLLSPACASWGMFDNFEQRGRIFKELVRSF